ncbi:MAG TPA: hypothetical protein VMW57_09785 [Methyloceanibacter sp.]|nr:hypothetical protein [Methyloceanibacter sp.]
MSLKSLPLAIFLFLGVSAWPSLVTPALAQDGDMSWQFYESNDPDNKGAMTARLIYGVPETDNVQVMGVCDARPSTGVKFSSVTFRANIGDLANGADAELRFSGGGFEQTLKGNVQRAQEEGINGVHLDIEHGDRMWTAFAEKDTLDYQVPGYRAAPLELEPGRGNIKSFIEACRTYEKAVLGDQGTDTTADSGDSSEKDAFNSAKELGTVAGFEAFLSNYPSGFYADLARAYVGKLNGASLPKTPAPPPPPPPAAPAPAIVTSAPGPDPSCRSLSTLRSQNSNTRAKLIVINKSDMYRSVMWIDFNGQPKDYGGLNAGDQMTLDTFMTHPWMIADGPGDCIEIVMPHAGTRVVELTSRGGTVQAPPPQRKASPPPAPAPKKAAPKKKAAGPKCRSRSILVDGKCILKSNAAGYCGPGYRVKNGKCVPGAYVAPKPKPSGHGCPPGQVWSPQELCHYDD